MRRFSANSAESKNTGFTPASSEDKVIDQSTMCRFDTIDAIEQFLETDLDNDLWYSESSEVGCMGALLRYYGAKWVLSKWIISHFPPTVMYDVFVDGFGGSGAITMAAPQSYIQVYNDLNKAVWTFMTVLRTRTQELVDAIMLTPYSRYELDQCKIVGGLDDLELARRFYVLSWQGRGFTSSATQIKSGWRYHVSPFGGNYAPNDFYDVDDIFRAARRFHSVQIENDDIFSIIDRYDSPKALFYLDPPYSHESVRTTKNGYTHEFPEHKHRDLLERIRAVEGFVILSGYNNPLYRDLLPDWQVVTKDARDGATNKQIEHLWLSPNTTAIQTRMW